MRKNIKRYIAIACALVMIFGMSVTAFAEESENKENVATEYYWFSQKPDKTWLGVRYICEIRLETISDKPVFAVQTASPNTVNFYYYDPNLSANMYLTELKIVERKSYYMDSGEPLKSDANYPVGDSLNWWNYGIQADGSEIITDTNIPVFENEESALAYFENGDDSGILNKPSLSDATVDETFALTGFQADNTVTATWTGTTHDDKADEYADMFIKLVSHNSFVKDSDLYGGEVINHLDGDYPISENMLSIPFEDLKKYCTVDGEYVSSLEFRPYYRKEASIFAPVYQGVSSYVYFDERGNITGIENGKTEYFEDNDFYLTGVEVNSDVSASLLNQMVDIITWTGVSDVQALLGVPDSDTYVGAVYSYYDESEELQFADYTYDEFVDVVIGDSNVHIGDKKIDIYTTKIINLLEKKGYVFNGEIWLKPYYTKNNDVYEGLTTCVNVLTGEITIIEEDEEGNKTEKPITPPKDDDETGGGIDISIPSFPSTGNVADIFSYMYNLFASLFSFVGNIPSLLAQLFAFIPEPILVLIGFALVLVIILRIIGR